MEVKAVVILLLLVQQGQGGKKSSVKSSIIVFCHHWFIQFLVEKPQTTGSSVNSVQSQPDSYNRSRYMVFKLKHKVG